MTLPHFSRHRERSDGTWYFGNYRSIFPDSVSLTPIKWYYESFKQSMDDCINPIGPRGFRSPGPCSAYKISRTGPKGATWTVAHTESGFDVTYTTDTTDVHHLDLSQIVSFIPSLPPSLLQDNRIAAYQKMITQIPPSLSIINFAIEILDFKESFAHYKKAVTKGGLKIHEVPGWANSTFLDFDFNLLPFVGDLIKITQVWDRVTKRLEFLLANRGKIVRQSFYNSSLWDENPHIGTTFYSNPHTAPFVTSYVNPEGYPYETYMGQWDGHPGTEGFVSLEMTSYKASFSASWYLLQELEGLDDAWAGLRALISGLGINNPAKIVWNAIPFSFIVDWMAPFGKALDSLAVQPFRGRWDVYDVVTSTKETIGLNQVRNFSRGTGGGYTPIVNPIVVEKYERRVGLDLSLSDIDLTDLTRDQQTLLASLFANLTLFKSGSHKKSH